MNARTGIDPAPCAIPYRDLKVIDPDVGHPLKITLNFDAAAPKAPDDDLPVEGAMTALLEASPDNISAEVLNVGPAKNDSPKIRSHRRFDVGSCQPLNRRVFSARPKTRSGSGGRKLRADRIAAGS